MREVQEELIRQKVLVADGDCLRLVQDYLFASPSLAAGVMLGRPADCPLAGLSPGVAIKIRPGVLDKCTAGP